MTVLHTGSTKAFSAGWSNIFADNKSAKKSPAPAAEKKSSAAKPAKKKPAKSAKTKKKAKK